MKAYRWMFVFALAVAMGTAAAALAADGPAAPGGDRPRLTPEERQQVRSILEQARSEIRPLREALRAEVEKLRDDLKAVVPPDVFQRMMRRFHERRQQFLDNHPRLRERLNRWRERRGNRQGAAVEAK